MISDCEISDLALKVAMTEPCSNKFESWLLPNWNSKYFHDKIDSMHTRAWSRNTFYQQRLILPN